MKKAFWFVLLFLAPLAPAGAESRLDMDGANVYLGLDEAVRLALERNPDLRTEALNPRLSEAAVMGERGVFDFYLDSSANKYHDKSITRYSYLAGEPIIVDERNAYELSLNKLLGFGTTITLSMANGRYATNSFTTFNPEYSASYTASLVQPLLRGFGRRSTAKGVRVARANHEISMLDFEVRVAAVLEEVVSAYWDALYARRSMKVAEESFARARDLYNEIEARVSVGLLPPVEMAQAEAGVSEREEAIVVSENALRAAEDRLRYLLGFSADAALWKRELALTDALPEVEESGPSMEEAVEEAFARRPEWRRIGREIENGRTEMRYARNRKRPELNLNASYGATGLAGVACLDTDGDGICDIPIRENNTDAVKQAYHSWYPNWSVGLTFSYAFRNRTARGAFEAARLGLEQAEIAREALEASILVEVRAAARDVETNLKRIEAARANRVLQQRKLDVETERHQNGLSTLYQVLQFQSDLTAAEAAELRALLDYHRSTVVLEKATGVLASKHGVELVDAAL
jgi:outer membrane protein TolC